MTALAAGTALTAAGVTWALLPAAGTAPEARGPVVAHAADHLPNETAEDWVSHADHVVVATPVEEVEIPPTATELARGEGLVDRQLTLAVDSVLWSRSRPALPAPERLDWQAFGWQFENGDLADRVELAAEDAPRLELGHQYILAIRWEEARCAEGDVSPARWAGLGADAIVPFDAGTIGEGEWQGTPRSSAAAAAAVRAHGPARSLEDRLVGRGRAELRSALEAARPATPAVAAAPASCG
jgi:hypothetical protein